MGIASSSLSGGHGEPPPPHRFKKGSKLYRLEAPVATDGERWKQNASLVEGLARVAAPSRPESRRALGVPLPGASSVSPPTASAPINARN